MLTRGICIILLILIPLTRAGLELLELSPSILHNGTAYWKEYSVLYGVGGHRYLVDRKGRGRGLGQVEVPVHSPFTNLPTNGSTFNLMVHSLNPKQLMVDMGLDQSTHSIGSAFYTSQIRAGQGRAQPSHLGLFGIGSVTLMEKIQNHPSTIWVDLIHEKQSFDSEAYAVSLLGFTGDDVNSKELFDITKRHLRTSEIITVGDTGVDLRHCFFRDNFRSNRYTFDTKNGDKILPHLQKASKAGGRLFGYISMHIPFGHYELRTDFDDNPNGHGSHVAGIALGSVQNSQCKGEAVEEAVSSDSLLIFDFKNRNGYDQAKHGLIIPPILTHLMQLSYASSSRVFTNSWGSSTPFYTSYAMEMDDFVYNHDDFVITVAAGNSGMHDRPFTICSPGTAKNVITVGASMNTYKSFRGLRASDFRNRRNILDMGHVYKFSQYYYQENLAGFSSRGPTADGRIKPDVVAPGEFIKSVRAKGESDSEMLYMRGTSMATPLVARIVSIIRGRLKSVHNVKDPSAALIKAILITTAQNLKGNVFNLVMDSHTGVATSHASEHRITQMDEGFGRVNLQPFLHSKVQWEDRVPLRQYEKPHSFCLKAKHGGTVSIGVVYSDPPALPYARDVTLNKLVFQVHIWHSEEFMHKGKPPDHSYFGNGKELAPDLVNNVQRVRFVARDGMYIRVSIFMEGDVTCFEKKALLEDKRVKRICKAPVQPVAIVYSEALERLKHCHFDCTRYDHPWKVDRKMAVPCTEFGVFDTPVSSGPRCIAHQPCPGGYRTCDFDIGNLSDTCTITVNENSASRRRLYWGKQEVEESHKASWTMVLLTGTICLPFVVVFLIILNSKEKAVTRSEYYRKAYQRRMGKYH